MNTRICPECGAAFTPQSKTQVCCSKECQQKRRRRLDNESRRRAEKARRLREFLATRDAAYERAGLPIPKISVCADGRIIERRGNCSGTGIRCKFPTL